MSYYKLKLSEDEISNLKKIINRREKYDVNYGNHISSAGKTFVIDEKFDFIEPLVDRVSKEIGIKLHTLDHINNTITVIEYHKEDFILPHYDFNWSQGDKFSLMYEINESDSNLTILDKKMDKKTEIKTDSNSIVVFNSCKYKYWIPELTTGYKLALFIGTYTSDVPVNFFKRTARYMFDKLVF